MFSWLFAAVVRLPGGFWEHFGPVGCSGKVGKTADFRLPAAPLPGETRPSAGPALPSADCIRPRAEAKKDAVKGVINDLLTGKQSSQGWEADLPAIMPFAACPRTPPSLWRLRSG